MLRRTHTPIRSVMLLVAVIGLLIAGFSGAAFAVSGGGYSPYQQGCQPGDDDYATPAGQTYPGCHDTAANLESGGTTDGRPSDGNTKYAQVGVNQEPIDNNSPGTPTPYSIGYPGGTASPHDGCVAVNTDGTGGQPAPAGTAPESPGQAQSSTDGCGDNSNGAGFASNFDYYQFYCPIADAVGIGCEDADPGKTTFTPYTGSTVASSPIVENGVLFYFGMDDNNDNGEHDGLGSYSDAINPTNQGAVNGPSDGGAIMLLLTPAKASNTPSQTHPEGLANASTGFCADGICSEGTTEQQTVYYGCNASPYVSCDKGTPSDANVYDYAPGGNPANDPSANTESPNCNSGGTDSASTAYCGQDGMDGIRSATPAHQNAEPGVQVYSDPDPERSPAAPAPVWPTPGVYVGTCGVYAGSPAITGQIPGFSGQSVGGQQVTNADGQLAVDPNPGAC